MDVWRDVPGFGGKYQTTADGRIRLCREIQPVRQRHGYMTVQIFAPGSKRSKLMTMHRLVALTWVPNPRNAPHVNHVDADRSHNAARNLEWCTPAENIEHAFKIGRRQHAAPQVRRPRVGGRHHRRLTSDQVRDAKRRAAAGELQRDIARSLGVSESLMSQCLAGITYKEITL